MRWTPEQYANYLYGRGNRYGPGKELTDTEKESVLSGKIKKWASGKGYPCQCFHQSKRAKGLLEPGWAD
jgi:hypothetical protein